MIILIPFIILSTKSYSRWPSKISDYSDCNRMSRDWLTRILTCILNALRPGTRLGRLHNPRDAHTCSRIRTHYPTSRMRARRLHLVFAVVHLQAFAKTISPMRNNVLLCIADFVSHFCKKCGASISLIIISGLHIPGKFFINN